MAWSAGRYSWRGCRNTATAALAIGLLSLFACHSPEPELEFNGTLLTNADPAPGFTLTDQFDRSTSLDTFSGNVVVLTFLYTNCPNVCPIVTSQLRDVYQGLGSDAESVSFVAVSVDPENDTVEAAARYLSKWELADRWRFLVGDRAKLEPIWESYYIDPVIDDPETATLVSSLQTPQPTGAIDTLRGKISDRFLVIHSTPVYLIDAEGRRRVVFTAPLDPNEVIQDIRTLLN